MTKSELLSALTEYPADAQIIFNDDEHNKVLTVGRISFLDGDLIPDLYPDKSWPKVIVHLCKKN